MKPEEMKAIVDGDLDAFCDYVETWNKPREYAQRLALIVRMRCAGVEWDAIGTQQGCGGSRAINLFKKAHRYMEAYIKNAKSFGNRQ